ncbi:MAG: hypothetical protein Fur0018_06560 [Anaerolineales bacterium]
MQSTSRSSRPPFPTRWWDLLNVFLLTASLSVLTARLTATEWVPDLWRTQTVNLLAIFSGLALGYSRFRPAVVRLFSLIFGAVVILWQLGDTLPVIPYWAYRLAALGDTWRQILGTIAARADLTIPLFFLTLTFIFTWALSSTAAFLLMRTGNPWQVMIPPGMALFIIHINDKFWPHRAWYLALYALLALILTARQTYLQNHHRWVQRHTRLPSYLGVDITRAAFMISIPLLFASWMLPFNPQIPPQIQTAWDEATSPLRERFRPLFASLRATVGVVSDYYGEDLTLGLGQPLANTEVMRVQAPADQPAGTRFYWLARVYDSYAENTWKSTYTEQAALSDTLLEAEARPLLSQPRWQATLTFQLARPFTTIHIVPQPINIDHRAQATFAHNPDGSIDLAFLQADPLLPAGTTYTVQAALTAATIADLRKAGSDYPDWVRERYLQLPPEITERTHTLARDLADGAQTPYDIAERVTRYLRQTITYQTSIDAPPREQEVVDWLLFDYRKGFCNYYATAEVVLLRSLGIPARLAVGYAQGEYHTLQSGDAGERPNLPEGGQNFRQSERAEYIVRQKDLHAWPEVYFPGIGWVEFEPTANQDPILRLSGEPINLPATTQQAHATHEAANPLPTPAPLPKQPNPSSAQSVAKHGLLRFILRVGSFVLALIVTFLLTARGRYVLRYQWLIRLRPQELPPSPLPEPPPPLIVSLENQLRRWGIPIPRWLRLRAAWLRLQPTERAYHEINRALRLLEAEPLPSATPAERAHHLNEILPVTQTLTARLLETYHRLRYAPQSAPLSTDERSQAGREIRHAALIAWLNRKLSHWQE